MLNNDNKMTGKASEVVQKVPTNEKSYHKCSFCVIDPIQTQHTTQQKKLDASKAPPAQLKKTAEEILKFVLKLMQYLAYYEFYTKCK